MPKKEKQRSRTMLDSMGDIRIINYLSNKDRKELTEKELKFLKKDGMSYLNFMEKNPKPFVEYFNKRRFAMVIEQPGDNLNLSLSPNHIILKSYFNLKKDLTVEEFSAFITASKKELEEAIQKKLIEPENQKDTYHLFNLIKKVDNLKLIEQLRLLLPKDPKEQPTFTSNFSSEHLFIMNLLYLFRKEKRELEKGELKLLKKKAIHYIKFLEENAIHILEFINKGRNVMVLKNSEIELNMPMNANNELLTPFIDLNKDLTIEEFNEMLVASRKEIEETIENKVVDPEHMKKTLSLFDFIKKSMIVKSIEMDPSRFSELERLKFLLSKKD